MTKPRCKSRLVEVGKVPSDTSPIKIPATSGSLLQVEFGMKSSVRDVTPILSGASAGYSCVFGWTVRRA